MVPASGGSVSLLLRLLWLLRLLRLALLLVPACSAGDPVRLR